MTIERSTWILLVIASAPKACLSPVQLQKSLFLLDQNLSDGQRRTKPFYTFQPYDYGPFDSDVYSDAERLEKEGLALIAPTGPGGHRTYCLTLAGSKKAVEMQKLLEPDVQKYVGDIVKWVCAQSFDGLVRTIYRLYPGMKVNSAFRS